MQQPIILNKRKIEEVFYHSKKVKTTSSSIMMQVNQNDVNNDNDIHIRNLIKEWTSNNSQEYKILLNYYIETLNNQPSITIYEWYKHLNSADFIKYLIKHDPFKEIYQEFKNFKVDDCIAIYRLSRFNQIYDDENCLLYIKKYKLGFIRGSKRHCYIEFSTRLMRYFLIYISSPKMGFEKYQAFSLYMPTDSCLKFNLDFTINFNSGPIFRAIPFIMNNSLLFSHFNTKCFDTNLDKSTKMEYLILPEFEKALKILFNNNIFINHSIHDNLSESEIILNGFIYKIKHLFLISKEVDTSDWDVEPPKKKSKKEFIDIIDQERDEITYIWIIRNYNRFKPVAPKYSNIVVIYLDISTKSFYIINHTRKLCYATGGTTFQFVKSEGELNLSNNLILKKENIKYYSNDDIYNLIHDINGMNLSTYCIEFDDFIGIELNLIIEKFTKIRMCKRIEKSDLIRKAIKLMKSKFPKINQANELDLLKFVDYLFENFTQLYLNLN